jgi:hypothetical protein
LTCLSKIIAPAIFFVSRKDRNTFLPELFDKSPEFPCLIVLICAGLLEDKLVELTLIDGVPLSDMLGEGIKEPCGLKFPFSQRL